MAEDQAPDVYADTASVNRTAMGYTLDFLRSEPPLPGAGEQALGTKLVARIRCSEPFIKILTQVLATSLTQDLPALELPPTRTLTTGGQVLSTSAPVPPPPVAGPAG